jgi:hypothetical protein
VTQPFALQGEPAEIQREDLEEDEWSVREPKRCDHGESRQAEHHD